MTKRIDASLESLALVDKASIEQGAAQSGGD
jgi:hypothetical protein